MEQEKKQGFESSETSPYMQAEIGRIFDVDLNHVEEATAYDMVTVGINARFQVLRVTVHNLDLPEEDRARLEAAILTAYNDAFKKVAEHAARQLTNIVQSTGA